MVPSLPAPSLPAPLLPASPPAHHQPPPPPTTPTTVIIIITIVCFPSAALSNPFEFALCSPPLSSPLFRSSRLPEAWSTPFSIALPPNGTSSTSRVTSYRTPPSIQHSRHSRTRGSIRSAQSMATSRKRRADATRRSSFANYGTWYVFSILLNDASFVNGVTRGFSGHSRLWPSRYIEAGDLDDLACCRTRTVERVSTVLCARLAWLSEV